MSLAKLGGAKRVLVSERDIQEREDLDEDEVDEHVEEHSKTPTAQSVRRNFDFDAPQHHDFNQDDTFTADSWFGNLMPIIDAEHKDSPDQGFGNIFDHLNEKPTSSIREFVDNNKSRRDSVHSMITQIRRRKSGRKITVPKPFHLLTNGGGVSKKVAVASPFVPLAVKLQKIQTDTPERFHKKPKKIARILKNELTLPKSPALTTKLRAEHSQTAVKSQAQIEDEEMARIKPFKANPVNRKILESKQVFVPQQTELTIPESPAINKPKQRVYNEPEPIRIKANPVPDLKKQFKPSIQSRKLAVPHSQLPGDYIHEKKRAEIAKKLEQEAKELEQSRKFKAQPILNVKQKYNSEYKPIPVTDPKPFSLMTDLRGNQYLKTFQRRVAEESKQKQFLAQPMPIVQPFQPERSKKPLTEVQPFVSHTSSRVEQRKHFDDEKTRRQKELEREEMEQAAAREEQEKKEIRKLRKNLVHKAQPVKKAPFVPVRPSDKKLTEPKTPKVNKRKYRK